MKTSALILTALIFAACASPKKLLRKPGATQADIDQDNSACQLEAMKITTADWEYRGTFMEGANIQAKQNKAMELCLRSKGYN